MKKTLVALAALAAAGASFAQVTISGKLIMGYEADTNYLNYGIVGGNNVSTRGAGDKSGLGVDTSVINFTATEDLGGGTKVTAVMGFDGVTRAGAFGGDSSLTVAGGFGTVKLATGRGADYLSAGISGVGGVALDCKLFTCLTAADGIYYTTPAVMPGLTFGVAHEEIAITQNDVTQVGIGSGAAGTAVTLGKSDYQRRNTLNVNYTSGALAAHLGYRTYDQAGNGTLLGVTGTSSRDDYTNSTRGAVSYDFGSFKLGAGFDQRAYAIGGTRLDTLVSFVVPMGALSIGGNVGSRVVSGQTAGSDGTQAGYSLSAAYNLSKTTAFSVNYASWDSVNQNSALNNGKNTTYTSVLLAKSF